MARVQRILAETPLIDGHNDLPSEIHDRFKSILAKIDLKSDTSKIATTNSATPLMTDIPRLRTGRVGGQFWAVWVPPELKGSQAIEATLW